MSEKSLKPLTCSRAAEWLHLLLDSELSSADHEKLLAHLHTCKRCSAAYRELSLIEAAHADLDARAAAAPQDYFEALPQKVLARIAAAGATQAQPRMITLRPRSFNLREFIWGRGKYALAFAAVLALAFIVTRQLRERGVSETALQETVPTGSPSVSQAAPPIAEAQIESKALSTSGAALSSEAEKEPATQPETAANAGADIVSDELALAAESSSPKEAAQTAESSADSGQAPFESAASFVAADADTIAMRQSLLANAPQFVSNPSNTSPQIDVESKEESRLDAAPSLSTFAKARRSESLSATRSSALETEPPASAARVSANDARLAQAFSASVQAQTQTERHKIWQDYFAYAERDSVLFNAAVESLAHKLSAQSDSSSSVTQTQEALSFYQTMEATLAARWGRVTYEQEKTRLEGLLNWKKAAQP